MINFTKDFEYCNDTFVATTKFGTQTAKIEFTSFESRESKTKKWYVSFIVYSKRKHIDANFDNCDITGKHGVEPLMFAKNAILEFEKFIMKTYPDKTHYIVVHWANDLRKKIYCHFLPRYGFTFGRYEGKIVLIKKCS